MPAPSWEHSIFHSILFGRANKLILFLTETRYGYASRRLALSLRTMPGALMCGWFSRRASRVSIKICDGKYRNNESARQQIDVSKSMRAPTIFALFPHILFFPLFSTTNVHCLDRVQTSRALKWIFTVYPWFVSGATAIKRNSNCSSIAFINSALHTCVSLSAQRNEGYRLNVLYEPIKSHPNMFNWYFNEYLFRLSKFYSSIY